MSRLYTLTEDNYKEVLSKLEKYCRNWRFLSRTTTYKVDKRNKKDNYPKSKISFQSKSWGYRLRHLADLMDKSKFVPVFMESDTFIIPTEHNFKKNHDDQLFVGYDYWDDMKPLIHLCTGGSTAIVLTYGDTVLFTKYGFTICVDNNYTRFGDPLLVYKHEYIIHRPKGRITDYDAEVAARNRAIEEDAEYLDIELDSEMDELDEDWDVDNLL